MREDSEERGGSLGGAPPFGEPLAWFEAWYAEAERAGCAEPNACTFATVGALGQPSARTVYAKEWGPDGIVVYTNLESRKGREALARPRGALLFWWRELERQARFEGSLGVVAPERADRYFATRARRSQLGAWASRQSRPLASRAELLASVERFARRFPGEVPRPPHWSGLRLRVEAAEFWEMGAARLHDRFRLERAPDATWSIERLCP